MRATHEMTASVPLPGASVAFDVDRVRKDFPLLRPGASWPCDVNSVGKDFPLLRQQVHGKPLVYLDNAATSQKPQAVIDRLTRYSAGGAAKRVCGAAPPRAR